MATPFRTPQAGDTGPAVVAVQELLNAYGAQLMVDGAWGPLTAKAYSDALRAPDLWKEQFKAQVARYIHSL